MYRRDNPKTSAETGHLSAAQSGRRQDERNIHADQRARAYTDTRTQPAVRPGTTPGGNTEQFRKINAERTAEHRQVRNSQTASIPAQRRGASPSRTSSGHAPARTGSAPYVSADGQRRNAPVRRRRKAPLYIRVLRRLYRHRKAVTAVVCAVLFLCITIPLAVYAASGDTGSKPADFEILSTAPAVDNMISAELAGDSFDADLPEISDDKGVTEDSSEPEPEDSTAAEDVTEDDTSSDTAADETTSSESTSDEATSDEATSDEPVQIEPEDTVPQFYVTIGFYDREPITCLTGPATLGDILYNAGCTLRDTDRPTVALDEMIESESWIMIDSVTYKTETVSEAIPFNVQTVEVQTVPRGTTRTVTAGVYGSREKVYTVQYVNGAEVERKFEYEYVSQYPQDQIDHYGTGGTLYAPDGSVYSYSYYLNVRATYYNIHGNTASGLPTSNSVMAVDPSVIPLGTSVYVMSDVYDMGVKIAADTGGAVKGNIIDIWMDENHPYYHQFAAQGVANMVAYILD